MSLDGSVTFPWGDGEHRFRLPIGQLRELQDKTDAGPEELLERLTMPPRKWRVDDIRETIRLGLIGGGTSPTDAHKLVTRYVEGRPWLESLPAARTILMAALVGDPDAEGNGEAEGTVTEPAETSGSSSPPSTGPGPL